MCHFLTPAGTFPAYNGPTTRVPSNRRSTMGTSAPGVAPRTDDTRDPVHDFDFLPGSWHIHHTQLVDRLAGSTTWREFEGTSVARPTMAGAGNIDDNVIE